MCVKIPPPKTICNQQRGNWCRTRVKTLFESQINTDRKVSTRAFLLFLEQKGWFGRTSKMAFVDQSRDSLESGKTVWQDVSGGLGNIVVGKFVMPSRAYIGRFNFKGNDQQKLVGDLSGGERGRLHLAKTLAQGGNVLMLDEPSNDLDVETLRALEDALLEFAGSIMVISHDRWFLVSRQA
jgi:ATPase subunit of ABC transporter with duplicated ATPase domains